MDLLLIFIWKILLYFVLYYVVIFLFWLIYNYILSKWWLKNESEIISINNEDYQKYSKLYNWLGILFIFLLISIVFLVFKWAPLIQEYLYVNDTTIFFDGIGSPFAWIWIILWAIVTPILLQIVIRNICLIFFPKLEWVYWYNERNNNQQYLNTQFKMSNKTAINISLFLLMVIWSMSFYSLQDYKSFNNIGFTNSSIWIYEIVRWEDIEQVEINMQAKYLESKWTYKIETNISFMSNSKTYNLNAVWDSLNRAEIKDYENLINHLKKYNIQLKINIWDNLSQAYEYKNDPNMLEYKLYNLIVH